MYAKKLLIGSNDVDQFLELKLSSFFKMMQDIATEHAEELDIGKGQTIDKGLYWVITRFSIDIINMPKYLENVTLKTYPGDNMRFVFPRYFLLEDENGHPLIKVSSVWMVLRKDNHQPCLNPFDGRIFPEEHLPDELPLPSKCSGEASSLVETRKVRYSDIDLNGHLNNTRYIELIQNLHDSDYYKDRIFDEITVNYFSEIKEKEDVSLYLSVDNNKEVIKGAVGDRESFKALIIYK